MQKATFFILFYLFILFFLGWAWSLLPLLLVRNWGAVWGLPYPRMLWVWFAWVPCQAQLEQQLDFPVKNLSDSRASLEKREWKLAERQCLLATAGCRMTGKKEREERKVLRVVNRDTDDRKKRERKKEWQSERNVTERTADPLKGLSDLIVECYQHLLRASMKPSSP